ncbi:MAG: hypothetical protein ACRYFK_07485 [Janthinobacterium lividum]
MQQLVFGGRGTLAYMDNVGAVVRLGGALSRGAAKGGTAGSGKQAGADVTTSVERGLSGLVAPWGPGNDFPQRALQDVSKSTIIGPVLDWKTRATYGQGIVYGKVTDYKDDGSEVFKRVKDAQVQAFFQKSNLTRYGMEGLQGLHYFAMAFPELIISRDRSQITSIAIQDTPFCRYSTPKPGLAVPEWVYISANWPAAQPGDGYTDRVPVLDPYGDVVTSLREDKRGFKYIYPLAVPSPGQSLYQLVSWNVIRNSLWLQVALAIPEFKMQLFKNQLTIKYLIEADVRYWEWKYPDWKEKKEGARKQIISDELAAFERTMAGNEGAGKSVMSVTMPDPANPGATIKVFTITPIDDKIKSGLYIEDSQEASSHIYTALQVDPTLSGISPGKAMGAGSGSDKRVAFNMFVATHKFHQDSLLEVLNLVRDYNGWDPELEFRFLSPQINTLDAKSETTTNANSNATA